VQGQGEGEGEGEGMDTGVQLQEERVAYRAGCRILVQVHEDTCLVASRRVQFPMGDGMVAYAAHGVVSHHHLILVRKSSMSSSEWRGRRNGSWSWSWAWCWTAANSSASSHPSHHPSRQQGSLVAVYIFAILLWFVHYYS